MAYVNSMSATTRRAVENVGTLAIPGRVSAGNRPLTDVDRHRGVTMTFDEWMASQGWTPGKLPDVGAIVWVQAYGEWRRGVVTETARTRATVATTTPSAIKHAQRHGGAVQTVVRAYSIKDIYSRSA